MSDDSSDFSDMNTRPSGSKGRQDQKRKRRIVMRIEFDDSGDTSSASDRTSDDEEEDGDVKGSKNDGGNDLDIDGPSCSIRLRNRQNIKNNKKYNDTNNDDDDDDSDEFHAATRRLRRSGRRANVLDVGFSDGSSSGSEITRKKLRGKKYIVSDDEREPKSPSNNKATKNTAQQQEQEQDEPGFTTDSSSNELLEKCPICLLTFRQQEVGSPSTCKHIFCANCIEAWSKNVQTCPIDRIEFQRIIVRESFENCKIIREINVDPNAQKELVLDDDDVILTEDVTNCEVCHRSDREDIMLLCDHCDQGYHMDCLSPPLSEIPEGSWFCDNCVDSEDEDEAGDVEEDLNMLYADIRDMGIPESRLRVREVPQQPRILRTRQNERIRAAILRRTRASVASLETTTTTTTSSAQRGRPRTSTTTTTTTTRRSTTNRDSSVGGSVRKPRKRRRRQRARQRTYVVEYDLNNFDEKFAIKTTKKVIRRRRRKARRSTRKGRRTTSSRGERMTASKRLAEQMGVKRDPNHTSYLSGSNAGLSLFGGANDLEYFSDSDNDGGNIESEIHIDTGHGTALQTSVRISNYGSQRSRKGLLLGRLQPNRGIADPVVEQDNTNPDILSSIMDMQDRWHSATRNMESVHINSDGTLNLPISNRSANNDTSPTKPTGNGGDDNKNSTEGRTHNGPSNDINQAPMYSRGGGNPNFNRAGGGGGGYNNRSNTNQSSYRGGGGNQYRNSTGGNVGGSGGNFGGSAGTNFNMVGRGNFNFSNNPNYNGPQQQNQQNNVSPFQQRNFNQRNQQNNTNNQRNLGNIQQRHSLPFTNNNNRNDINQQQQPIANNRFGHMPPQTCLPPPSLLINQQPPPIQQNLQQLPPMNENNSLFGGLPPPMSIPPPHLNVAPPSTVSQIPVIMSVPPPPAPPSVAIPPPANNSLFQLNSDYGNDDDDSNCPNFAIYSHESQQVAKSTESYRANAENTANAAKEDDENEDLVQLDDDDEIPMPPEPSPSENVEPADLYEPENPTEENDDNNDYDNSACNDKNATKDDGDDFGDDNDDDEENKNKKSEKDIDKNLTNSDKYDPEDDAASQSSSNADKTTDEKDATDDIQQSDAVRSPSPATSEIRLPENETAAANRKGVLELYDDSDWEELDIDRPKDNDKKDKNITKTVEDKEENENEQDRSYTPCLDENNDPEEPEDVVATPGEEEKSATVSSANKNTKSSSTKSNRKEDKKSAAENIKEMDTELISEEEEEDDIVHNKDRKKSQKGNNDKRDRRGGDNGKVETFKKIGNKQKIRNYRGDQKQPEANSRRTDKRRRSRSPGSRSRSRSADSFRSRGGRSRSRSPRYRGRGDRSRSRSNNKENQGRWAGNQRDGGRFHRHSQFNQNNRLKRRELPRYDVRNVVGHHSSPSKVVSKDRYGRDTSRNRRNSRSLSRGRRVPPSQGRSPFSRSRSRSRNKRLSISLSPSPSYSRRRSMSPPNPPRRFSPVRRRSASDGRRTPPFRQQRSSRSPLRVMRSRSISPTAQHRMNGRKVTRHLRGSSQTRNLNRGQRSRSLSLSPRYTPRISRSRSKSPRPKGSKKKKAKDSRKKKSKRRVASISPSPNRRITRQPDPFDIQKPAKKKRRRSPRAKSPPIDDHGWSPSPSPPPTQAIADNFDYPPDKNVSWTPPMQSPLLGLFRSGNARSVSRSSRKDKTKRGKKKKKTEKRREGRKEKKRKRRTETPEPAPSKEVFASGNNILVSVSFNKETTLSQQHSQQTIVTLPPNREDLLSSNRRTSVDHATNSSNATKRRKDKRKKIDTKPVAIIDLERSPFQVEQEPTDVIVLTDSEEANEREQQRDHRRDRHRSESSCPRDTDAENTTHRNQRSGGGSSGGQRGDKSTPERLDTIREESYELTQTGPKTPPEPPLVKFNLQTKKQSKVRNPLHEDEDDMASDGELNERQQQQQQQENHRSDMDTMHVQSSQKIGPNTPPESGPCSPDAYDPFEPTKSPSISPRSPTPPASQLDVSQNSICGESNGDLVATQKHIDNEQQQRREQIPGLGGNVAQGASLNPVDLVMALINSKSTSNNNNQDLSNKSNDSQHLNGNDDSFRDKGNDEGNSITVLSNLLISSGNMQHIPSISSPTPPSAMSKKLPALPKIGSSVGGSSSSGVNVRNGGTGAGTSNNADDSFNMNDIESPYSPGSAEYDDLFEPPPEISSGTKRRSKRGGKPAEVFDNLFGSSSPIGNLRLPSYTPSKKHKGGGAAAGALRKSKVKVGKSNDDAIKVYDDIPNSAVELHVKDKFLRKLNRQERVVEEVKLILKPRFNKKQITKDDYKDIMRRAVPKICHSKSGEIDPLKIKKLIEAYVKKFRSKHKKLNIVNTGQVSSAVKCAAYLKKL